MTTIAQAIAARLARRTNCPPAPIPIGPVVATSIHVLDASDSPVHLGQLVQLVGASHSGKTQLLHAVAAHALQSRADAPDAPRACWFDLNGAVDLHRLQSMASITPDAISSRLQLYRPQSTFALCSSLHSLCHFLNTAEGRNVNTVIIDALGAFHYLDKFPSPPTTQDVPVELVLVNVLRQLLTTRKVAVYVSKCPIFDDLPFPAKWPFVQTHAPSIPRDFMPSAWNSIVSHTVLVYFAQPPAAAAAHASQHRAVVALAATYTSDSNRQLRVTAASIIEISDVGIVSDVKNLHKV